MLVEGIMPHSQVEDFLEKVHDIDSSDIVADAALRDLIGLCGTRDRRFVFTASTKEHASRCLAKVFSPMTADDLFTTIVDTRVCELETKHHESSFRKAMAACNVPPTEGQKCILLDDSVTNIKKAKAMGWTTVLVGKTVRGTGELLSTPAEADHHIGSLHELPATMPELFVTSK
jgi:FMN phosphatase YigB (HAD superfamily)